MRTAAGPAVAGPLTGPLVEGRPREPGSSLPIARLLAGLLRPRGAALLVVGDRALAVAGHALRVVVHDAELVAGVADAGIARGLKALHPLGGVFGQELAHALVMPVFVAARLVAAVAGLLVGGHGLVHVALGAERLLVGGSEPGAAAHVAPAARLLEQLRRPHGIRRHLRAGGIHHPE